MWPGGFDKNSGPGSRQQTPPSSSSSSWFNGSSLKPHQSPSGAEFPAKNQIQDLKRTRSPPPNKPLVQNSTTLVGSHLIPQINKSQKFFPARALAPSPESQRPSLSPPRLSSNVWTPPYTDLDKPETAPSELPVPKRTRPLFSTNMGLRGNNSVHGDAKRYDAIDQRLWVYWSKQLAFVYWSGCFDC